MRAFRAAIVLEASRSAKDSAEHKLNTEEYVMHSTQHSRCSNSTRGELRNFMYAEGEKESQTRELLLNTAAVQQCTLPMRWR